MTDHTRDAKNASEGELLRNQIAQTIEETPMVLVDDWNPPRHDSFDLADAILARFDVRLREPQAEETR